MTLRLWPTVFAMTPDDAMALSIELQKAAIDARRYGRQQIESMDAIFTAIDDEVRGIVERNWSHLGAKLPPHDE